VFERLPCRKTKLSLLLINEKGATVTATFWQTLWRPARIHSARNPETKFIVGIAHDGQDGSLPVDYGKSLFELYEDVVRFQYRSYRSTNFKPKTIVHFSQLVQQLLGGHDHMLKDLAGKPNPLSPIQSVKHDPFKVTSGVLREIFNSRTDI
jgi:hypothetical protein